MLIFQLCNSITGLKNESKTENMRVSEETLHQRPTGWEFHWTGFDWDIKANKTGENRMYKSPNHNTSQSRKKQMLI